MKEPVVGIDLGTRYAQLAINDHVKGVRIIPNRWGSLKTPSFVALTEDGFVVGEDAAKIALLESKDVWWDMKRHLGTDWVARSRGRAYTPEELLLPILSLMREDAEAYLKTFVFSCVLAVPAHFGFPERGALARAAQLAGFEKVRIVNEPTAAALSAGRQGRFLVVDFGAGTFDLSVVEGEDGVFQVLESHGRSDVGGFDLDKKLAEWLWKRLGETSLRQDDPKIGLLLSEAENIKITLSSSQRTVWTPPAGLSRSVASVEVSRADFEPLIFPYINALVLMIERMWRNHSPDRLILVGGSSKIPLFRNTLSRKIQEPEHLRLCPEEAVVMGTALYADQGRERLLIDVLSRSLGIMDSNGCVVTLLERGVPLPIEERRRFNARGSGMLEITVIQGEGKVKSLNRVLETIKVDNVGDGEDVEVIFKVDGGGLLHVEVNKERSRQKYKKVIALESDESNSAPCDLTSELRFREDRLARLSMSFPAHLQDRLKLMMSNARILKNEPPELQWQALETIDRMISDMEQVTSP